MMRNLFPLSFLALSLILPACENGVRSASVAPTADAVPGEADFLLGATGEVELSDLRAPATSLRLSGDGGVTANLLVGEQVIDFLALGDAAKWICKAQVPAGTYTRVELGLDTTRFTARTANGAVATVLPVTGTLTANFALPLEVASEGLSTVTLDLRLDEAVRIGADFVEIDFTGAVGATFADGDGEPVEIDEVIGVVSGALVLENALLVESFSDLTLQVPTGPIPVFVDEETQFIAADGAPFADPLDFFAGLILGETVLRMRGQLASGALLADRIEVRGSFPELVAFPIAEVEGQLVAIPSSGRLVLAIASVAGDAPALEELGILEVSLDTNAALSGPSGILAPEDLATGQRLRVAIDAFAVPPFRARGVEVLETCDRFTGVVSAVEADGFVLELSGSSPGAPAAASVRWLPGASVTLELPGAPQLDPSELPTGVRVQVQGCFQGGVIESGAVTVRPGLLAEGVVGHLAAGGWSFTTSGGVVSEALGSSLGAGPAGPLEFILHPQAQFLQGAHSKAQFEHVVGQALDCSPGGDCLPVEVRVRGIAAVEANQVLAFEIATDVQTP